MADVDPIAVVQNIRHGPHQPPYITCRNCGTEHHYDAVTGEYQGQCRQCYAYLRRPTEAEHKQFTEFLAWNSSHMEREREKDEQMP